MTSPTSFERVAHAAEERKVQGRPRLPDQVQLGSGNFFRPMKGLCALFARIGTKCRCVPRPPPSLSPVCRRSFADKIRVGKAMAAHRSDGARGFGERGGGRGASFNLGFRLGFDPGFGGRGCGRDHFLHGRGRRHAGHSGFGYNSCGSGYQGVAVLEDPMAKTMVVDEGVAGGQVTGSLIINRAWRRTTWEVGILPSSQTTTRQPSREGCRRWRIWADPPPYYPRGGAAS